MNKILSFLSILVLLFQIMPVSREKRYLLFFLIMTDLFFRLPMLPPDWKMLLPIAVMTWLKTLQKVLLLSG